jgi:hypothetical protein
VFLFLFSDTVIYECGECVCVCVCACACVFLFSDTVIYEYLTDKILPKFGFEYTKSII